MGPGIDGAPGLFLSRSGHLRLKLNDELRDQRRATTSTPRSRLARTDPGPVPMTPTAARHPITRPFFTIPLSPTGLETMTGR